MRRQLPFILAGVVLMTLQPILVTLSQDASGKFQYSTISSTLLTGMRVEAPSRRAQSRQAWSR